MDNSTVVEKVVEYIEVHIGEGLSLDHIAQALNYSKFYLARVFHKKTDGTIYQYIQQRRLTLAAQKLVETEEPIIEIAYEARYNSQQAFTYAFHKLYECTPKTYRKIGVYYPKQPRLGLQASLKYHMISGYIWGGRIAA